jgi:hypothetical protein
VSIDQLADGMKQIAEHGKVDIQLSEATRDKYVTLIDDFRDALQRQLDHMRALETLGPVGELSSAQQTKTNLTHDVTGTDGIEDVITHYMAYLDEFKNTVKKACDRLLDAG